MKNTILFFLVSMLISCSNYDTKWEEIKGIGTSDGESLQYAIYFQDTLNGIIGGYKNIYNNTDKPINIPVLYLTQNGGKKWKPIRFDNVKIDEYLNIVNDIKLTNDTILCQIGGILLQSNDLGLTWHLIEKSDQNKISEKYFPDSHEIQNENIEFENKKYRIKESHKYKNTEVIICKNEKHSMTDYYFISKDNGNTWSFLQSEFASNKSKFLLKDEYLFAFDTQYGLQKLKLK